MKVVFNKDAFYEVRSLPGVVALVESKAEAMAAEANSIGKGTYATGSRQGLRRPQGRWRASVVTADARAQIDNARHNTLARVLGGSS
ncbi:MAG: hypothetical protein WBA38_04090 [Gordonia sp. (in: high G+C Gram-positive bacteria)]|uniref:hypothetical protein n=1 Tax=Gordonia sp. (in: high G+C Gram-positive bacteria) TaxID=84139 RepID=UPI003C723427